ncbi:hypothetical protein I7I48_02800 [Histoplasma ohiense]|nr:hypothetical protein I7I48_02800 [Histoplasma ohiense (nom. inval.)]
MTWRSFGLHCIAARLDKSSNSRLYAGFVNHLCETAWSAVMRTFSSRTRSLRTKPFARSPTRCHSFSCSRLLRSQFRAIFWEYWPVSGSVKGDPPVRRTTVRQPNDHISTAFVYPFPLQGGSD